MLHSQIMKMSASPAELDYIICECGIDFNNAKELQKHLIDIHLRKKSITADDGDTGFYLLEVEKDSDNDRNSNSNAEECQVKAETVGEYCEIIESNEMHPEVDENSDYVVNCDVEEKYNIKLEPNKMFYETDVNAGTVQNVENVKEEKYDEVATVSDIPNLPASTVDYYIVQDVTEDGNIVMLNDELTNEICLSESLSDTHEIKESETEVTTNVQLTSEEKSLDEPRYCELCLKVFVGEKVFQAHFKKVHLKQSPKEKKAEEDRTHICYICGRDYATKPSLNTHLYTHSDKRPYKCSFCGKGFRMKLNLQIHERIHTDERPYQCELCPKAFRNKAAINRHSRVHTGIKPYSCPECGRAFSQSNSMKWHVRTVHWNEPWPYKKKKIHSEDDA